MNKYRYWLLAARPKTLIASAAPVVASSILCVKYYSLDYFIFFCTLIAAILIQIMTNFINDLYDFKKGADSIKRIGPDRMIQKGNITEIEMKKGILFILILSILVGLYLVISGGWIILLIGLSAFLFAYLYTATNLSIAYNGLGEIFVFIYFGLIATLGTFYLQTAEINYDVLLIGAIFGFLNMSLLIINNLRDLKEDREANKKTLAVLFGEKFAKIELLISNISAYMILFLLLLSLDKVQLFFIFIIIIIIKIKLLYKICYDIGFLNSTALQKFSLSIFCFTFLLSLVIMV